MRENAHCPWKRAAPTLHGARCRSLAAVLLVAPSAAADGSPATRGEEQSSAHGATTAGHEGPLVEVEQGWLRGVSDEERQAHEPSAARYEFDDPAAPAPHWMPVPPGFVMGSTHSSDAPYIFDRRGLVQPDAAPFDSDQLALGRQLRQAIGGFLRAGDPSPEPGPTWPGYEPETGLVMLMQPGGLNVTRAYSDLHHCDFWDSVPPPVL